jgi:GR25 family glycosyltransferase involved in LPS biosynthesis
MSFPKLVGQWEGTIQAGSGICKRQLGVYAGTAEMDDVAELALTIVAKMRLSADANDRIQEIQNCIGKIPGLLATENYDRLVNLIDALLAQDELTWGMGLEMAEAIARAGSQRAYQDTLTRLTSRFPRCYWVWHKWIQASNRSVNRETTWLRAQHTLDRFPGDKRVITILAHAGIRARRFSEVINIIDSIDFPERDSLIQKARTYLNIENSFKFDSRYPVVDYSIYCVNHHHQRLEAFASDIADLPLALRRVPGIRGSQLPKALREILTRYNATGTPSHFPGAFGCFLGHVGAWEAFLRSSDKFALVVEDDARLLTRLPAAIECLHAPEAFDIIFVNERTENVSRWAGPEATHPEFFSLEDAMASRPMTQNAPGGDGYILSREGAKKALETVHARGFAGDVDWYLALLAAPGLLGGLGRPIRLNDTLPSALKGFSLFPSLVASGDWGSSRETESDLWRRYI